MRLFDAVGREHEAWEMDPTYKKPPKNLAEGECSETRPASGQQAAHSCC